MGPRSLLTTWLFDTGIWLGMVTDGDIVPKARRVLRDPRNSVVTSAVSLAEITSILVRRGLHAKVSGTLAQIRRQGPVVDVDVDTFVRAGEIHGKERSQHSHFSLADCIILDQARSHRARILTTDRKLAANRQGVKATSA